MRVLSLLRLAAVALVLGGDTFLPKETSSESLADGEGDEPESKYGMPTVLPKPNETYPIASVAPNPSETYPYLTVEPKAEVVPESDLAN